MAPDGSPAGIPPWSQMASPVTHIRPIFTTLRSPVLPLFIVSTSFCFSLFHFSTIYLHTLVRLSSGLRIVISHLCIMVPCRGHIGHGLPPEACGVPDWWPFQGSFLFGALWQLSCGCLRLASHLACPSGPRQGSSVSGSLPPRTRGPRCGSSHLQLASCSGSLVGPSWCWTAGHLRLAFFRECWLLIIQLFTDLNTEHRHSPSPLCYLLTHM